MGVGLGHLEAGLEVVEAVELDVDGGLPKVYQVALYPDINRKPFDPTEELVFFVRRPKVLWDVKHARQGNLLLVRPDFPGRPDRVDLIRCLYIDDSDYNRVTLEEQGNIR